MDSTTRARLISVLNEIDRSDLDELHALVKEAVDRVTSLKVGDKVSFNPWLTLESRVYTGRIIRVHGSAVVVRADRTGSEWSLPGSRLTLMNRRSLE